MFSYQQLWSFWKVQNSPNHPNMSCKWWSYHIYLPWKQNRLPTPPSLNGTRNRNLRSYSPEWGSGCRVPMQSDRQLGVKWCKGLSSIVGGTRKINMESKNHPIEKENHLQKLHHFGIFCGSRFISLPGCMLNWGNSFSQITSPSHILEIFVSERTSAIERKVGILFLSKHPQH